MSSLGEAVCDLTTLVVDPFELDIIGFLSKYHLSYSDEVYLIEKWSEYLEQCREELRVNNLPDDLFVI